jgi:hypothetical protein
MSKMETNLAPEELRLLRGILESHKDQLEQLQDGDMAARRVKVNESID